MFNHKKSIRLPPETPPLLIVVIDTEEEFDWSAKPDPKQTAVRAMAYVDRAQSIFNEYGIQPCYVVDYPVVSQAEGHAQLKQYHSAGQCVIGAHLHPWVNPPLVETVNVANMYPGNLPAELERGKLMHLRNTIADIFGEAPTVYKAGRYGFGPNTESILAELGFEIDVSVCPPVDFRSDGGPDYRRFNAAPFWFGTSPLLEIPLSGAFVGWAHSAARPLFDWASRLKRFRAPGILSRLSAVDRLMLSPEGFTPNEHIKLTQFLFAQGVRTFTWSFHSPSLVPGNTSYVRNDQELSTFLDAFHRYFDYFFGQLGGRATTPNRLKTLMENNT